MRRVLWPVLLCLLALGAGAGAASAATRDFPVPGGFQFSGGTDGFSDVTHTCTLIGLPLSVAPLCETSNDTDAAGNPGGSLRSSYESLANLLGLGTGTAEWESPAFQVGNPGDVVNPSSTPALRVDRHAFVDALLDQGGHASTRVDLIDTTSGATLQLLNSELDRSDSGFTRNTATLLPSAITPGHSYRIRLRSVFSSSLVQILAGSVGVNWDNVVLSADVAPPAPPPPPPVPGGPVVGPGNTAGCTGGEQPGDAPLLTGTVNPNPAGNAVQWYFEYGPRDVNNPTTYAHQTVSQGLPAGYGATQVAARPANTTPTLQNHARLVVIDMQTGAITYGPELFYTGSCGGKQSPADPGTKQPPAGTTVTPPPNKVPVGPGAPAAGKKASTGKLTAKATSRSSARARAKAKAKAHAKAKARAKPKAKRRH